MPPEINAPFWSNKNKRPDVHFNSHTIQQIYKFFFFQPLFIGRHLDDMHRMEIYLESEKDIDFIVVRPPGLENGPVTEREIKVVEGQWVKNHEMGWGMSMPRADVGRFMLSWLIQ